MSSIPASDIVQILPGVLDAGGNGLQLNAIAILETPPQANFTSDPNWRSPIGSVLKFISAKAVGAYFGQSSDVYKKSVIYFNSYKNKLAIPPAIYTAQWPANGAAAWLLGGKINSLSQIQAINGTLTVVVDGATFTAASLNLSSASSPTAAATLIQTALDTSLPGGASSLTSTIAGVTSSFTGSIAGDLLDVTSTPSNTIVDGTILSGTGVTASTQVVSQLTTDEPDLALGKRGTYAVSIAQNVAATTITGTYGLLTAGTVSGGTISVGQTVTGGSTAVGTVVTQDGGGAGLAGVYYVNKTQTVSSSTLTYTATALSVTYDSTAQAFLIKSGFVGDQSSIAFASGTTAAPLKLTSVTGAILSQGSDGVGPYAFMDTIPDLTQNWASFFNIGDPDFGNGCANKLEFARWNNDQENRYAYVAWDTDIQPTLQDPATNSFGYLVNKVYNYSGIYPVYDPNNQGLAAFNASIPAAWNTLQRNGRTVMAFRSQDGLIASVTNQQVANNLRDNGYNIYGDWATANQNFIWDNPGQISGDFLWGDSYFGQIWFNSNCQLALMELLQNINTLPYVTSGYTAVEQALMDPITAAINFGTIRVGVPLSEAQALEVNTLAGIPVSDTITQQGWYLQITPAPAQTRAQRNSPAMILWYTDGQSIQKLVLSSIEIL